MSQTKSLILIHVGPIRTESQKLIQNAGIPAIVFNIQNIELFDVAITSDLEKVSTLVASQSGETDYFTFNLAQFDSTVPETGLKDLYPGLRKVKSEKVGTKTLSQALQELDIPDINIGSMIVEQPEDSLNLLTSWEADGLLEVVDTIWIRTSPVSLYKGMPTQEELIGWCSQHGFEKYEVADAEDPDFILQGFKRNPMFVSLKAAQTKIAELTNYKKELKLKLEEAAKNNLNVREELEKTHQWFLNRKQEAEERKEQHDKIKKEYNALNEKYEQLTQLADERQQQVHELQRQNQKLKGDNQQLTERQAQLQNELIRTESHVELIKELITNG